MDVITNIRHIIENYKLGHRYFINLDFDKGEKLNSVLLIGTTFENCYFSADFTNTDFSNSKFINCNLKCSDFTNCNLTNTLFENCLLEGVDFKNAIIEGTKLLDCSCFGLTVYLDKMTKELLTFKDPLVKELYDYLPEFNALSNHVSDDSQYNVYGELSIKLYNSITINEQLTEFTIKCFQFFNLLGDREDDEIDNLLVVGIYEGLYANKKCNAIARQLLTGRNKEVYEHWMINGNIRSDY